MLFKVKIIWLLYVIQPLKLHLFICIKTLTGGCSLKLDNDISLSHFSCNFSSTDVASYTVCIIKGIGDGATSEARALPLFESSLLNQSSNKDNWKSCY